LKKNKSWSGVTRTGRASGLKKASLSKQFNGRSHLKAADIQNVLVNRELDKSDSRLMCPRSLISENNAH
jgi:hypothetical protein